MASPARILKNLEQGDLRVLDLGSFANQWQRFVLDGEHAGCASLADFLALLEGNERLAGVEVLNLAENRLRRLPPLVARLPRLAELNLYRNELEDLPPCLAGAGRLRVLRLRENELCRLPEVVLELPQLEELYLDGNPLAELPAGLAALARLRVLSLAHTKVEDVPAAVVDMASLVDLDARNTPLRRIAGSEVPRSAVAQGLNAWRAWRAISSGGAAQPDEVKVVFVGAGRSGKTTLLRNLRHPDVLTSLERNRTKGLEVHRQVTLPRVTCRVRPNLWDFGGQGKYRQLQQLFCTPDAVYVYVRTPDGVDAADDDSYVGDDYWLSMISAFQDGGGDQAPRSVLYVVTKVDKARKPVLVDEADLNRRFPAVREFHKVSLLDGRGVDALRSALAAHLESVRQLDAAVPREWHEIRGHLRQDDRWKQKSYITRREFYDLCARHGVSERTNQRALLGYLNRSGALLQLDEGLKHRILLQPDWVRDPVCAVLDYPPAMRRGWFADADLERIWGRSLEEEEQDGLLGLMKAFELCYEAWEDGERRYFVPALFPELPPDGYRFEDLLAPGARVHRVRCEFAPFLPAGLVAQLMANLGDVLHRKTRHRWRTGLVFELAGTWVELREDWRGRLLEVALAGGAWVEEYHRVIRRKIEDLREKLASSKGMIALAMRDSISCPCLDCRRGGEDQEYRFELGPLLEAPSARGFVTCPKSGRQVAVAELLDGRQSRPPATAPPGAFLSYNERDRCVARRLSELLERRGVQPFLDSQSDVHFVDDFIKTSLERADVLVLLVSRHSLVSIWVLREVKIARELGRRILPLVVDEHYDDDDFQSQAIDHLTRRLDELEEERARIRASRTSTAAIDARIQRCQDARQNLDSVLKLVDELARLDPRRGGSLEDHADAIVRAIYQSRAG